MPNGGVTTLSGEPFLLSSAIEGRPAVLNFWASWCPFCAAELPSFQSFANSHPSFAIIAINLQEDVKVVERYWRNGGYTFPTVLDPNAVLKKQFSVFTQPTTIFLNAAGDIVERRDGPLTEEELRMYADRIQPKKEILPPMEDTIGDEVMTSAVPGFLERWYEDSDADTVKHTVDFDDILSGGVGRDGIPAIDSPRFVSIQDADFLKPDDVGSLFMTENTARFYPFRILNWHEIVNDTVEGEAIMITYCPLCDSAAVYSRDIAAGSSTFGVSGFLYQSNLVMYDRKTESLWNQITGKAMIGELTEEELTLLPSNVVKFSTVQEYYPKAEILSTKTGYLRDYSRNPYRGYADDEEIMFPVHTKDARLPAKERILGLAINGDAKAYPRSLIEGKATIRDTVGGKEVIISQDQGKVTFLVDGVRTEPVHNFWFSWVAQYPETEIYE